MAVRPERIHGKAISAVTISRIGECDMTKSMKRRNSAENGCPVLTGAGASPGAAAR